MIVKLNILLALIFSMFSTQLLSSNIWVPHIINYSTEQYRGGTQSWDIAQNTNSWYYFGNNYGLLEFDGRQWNTYGLPSRTIVRSVECDDNGYIYVGGRNEFGRYVHTAQRGLVFENLSNKVDPAHKLFKEVWDIHIVGEKVYFQTKNYIFTYDNDTIECISSVDFISEGCVVNNLLYVATYNGVFVIDGNNFIPIPAVCDIPYNEIYAMESLGSGRFLIATLMDGLFICDGNTIQKLETSFDDYLRENMIYDLAVGEDKIAIGTIRRGAVVCDLEMANPQYIDVSRGLANNTALSCYFDNDNKLWLALDNGIASVDIDSPLLHTNFNHGDSYSGYTSSIYNSKLYLGTNQGLLISNPIRDITGCESLSLMQQSSGQVWKLENIDGVLYCCHNRGLFRVEGQNFIPIFSGDGVWNVEKIDRDRFVIGTYSGFKLITRKDGRYITTNIEGYDDSINFITYQLEHRVAWLVTGQGLEKVSFNHKFNRIERELMIESDDFGIFMLNVDNNRVVYSKSGVYIIDKAELKKSDKYDYLFDSNMQYVEIMSDNRGNIWYMTPQKLYWRDYYFSTGVYSKLRDTHIDMSDLMGFGFVDIKSFENGNSIISTISGYSLLDRKAEARQVDIPTPLLRKLVTTTNPQDSIVYGEYFGSETPSVNLDYADNSIKLQFSASPSSIKLIEYSYMLEGVDDDWSMWNSGSTKEYTELREGEYKFKLRAKDSSQQIGERVVTINIEAPFYRSAWAYTFYALLVLCAVAATLHFVRKRMINIKLRMTHQREMELEHQMLEHTSEINLRESQIVKLENEKLEAEIKRKSAELSSLMLSKLDKHEIVSLVSEDLKKIQKELAQGNSAAANRRLSSLNKKMSEKMIDNIDWSDFEENFNVVNDGFVEKLTTKFTWMNTQERKLCVYIRMGLQNKEIAPLLNLSVRGVEMLRYRTRKKMDFEPGVNMHDFLQSV